MVNARLRASVYAIGGGLEGNAFRERAAKVTVSLRQISRHVWFAFILLLIASFLNGLRGEPIASQGAGGSRNNVPSQSSDTDASTVITVHMGDVTMKIPKAYFLSPPRHEGRSSDAIAFLLLSLLPDFAPRSPATLPEFAVPGWHRQILIGVFYKGYMQTGAALLNTWYHYSNEAEIRSGQFGYHFFQKPGFDELFKGTLENPTDIVSCRPASGPLSGPSPYCERIVLVGPDITVQYSFSRAYLGQTQSLDEHVIGFLNQLRISGPEFRIVQ